MNDHPFIRLFNRYLREQGLPVTHQRNRVAAAVFGSEDHLSVDDIEGILRAQGERIGKATIYRTAEILVRSGLVEEHDFGEGFKRYEPARGIPHHEHLLCTVCGRVTEFRDERLERMTTLIAEAHGHMRQRHRLVPFCGVPVGKSTTQRLETEHLAIGSGQALVGDVHLQIDRGEVGESEFQNVGGSGSIHARRRYRRVTSV